MKDFTDAFESHLRELADEPSPEPTTPWWRSRLMAATTGLAAALAAAATALVIAAPSHAELPILKGPTEDIRTLKEQMPALADAGMQFDRARHFDTPGGRGFALVDADEETICVAIPDPGARETFGTSCQSIELTERDGFALQLIGNRAVDPRAVNTFAFVLPDGAQDVRLVVGGKDAEPIVTHGIVVGNLHDEATLSWTVGGDESRHRLSGPETTRPRVMVDCGAGRGHAAIDATGMSSEELARERRRVCAER